MIFNSDKLSDLTYARSLEWLETNGLGGYASGTVSGINTRRYHGLLVASMHPPVDRKVMVSKLEETIVINNIRYALGSNQFPGAVHPKGYEFLQSFERDIFPVLHYRVGEITLKKTIVAVHGENTTLILYEIIDAPKKFSFELLPLYSCRDFHCLSHVNANIDEHYLMNDGIFRTLNYQGCPEVFIAVPASTFREQKDWYRNFEYAVEQERGLDFTEDLYTHGNFIVELAKGDKLGIIISTEDPTGRDAFALFDKEKKRREVIGNKFSANDKLTRLAQAADQFIVKRGKLSTVVAGYHWFADWGRDTMISLPGLCLVTGRFEEAKKIIKTFSLMVSEGMLPNRFPDHGEVPEYNTVDATLWFFYAVYKYYKYTGDKAFVKTLLPVLKDIIQWHYKGTRYGIHIDPVDELLYAGQDGVQLTWMDAKVDQWIVTPRKGKAVEINALWYNALCIFELLLEETDNKEEAKFYKSKSKKVLKNFNAQFWNPNQNCLYDYIDGEYKNDDLRPNQIYAISLPFSLLSKDKEKKVLDIIGQYLLTPKGLRSLSPLHKDYRPVYEGNIWSRDGAYHQGTVWSFLLGAYIDALVNVNGKKGRGEASLILTKFFEQLDEGCVGSVSEIFDGDAPHTPRGCVAQAWGVAEVLRVAVEYNLID